ncbi:MAG TPA: hypothetical protein VK675_04365 [Candidatus Paceibacterota bacterium]|nr:hypothetical protein [Candidatus Paceibacterota bacterium]
MELKQIVIVVILLIIIFFFIWGFNKEKNKPAIINSFQLVQERLSKEKRPYNYTKDWVDLVFTVTEKHLSDSNPRIKAEGILNEKNVGFVVEINDRLSKENKKIQFVPNGIVLKSIGEPSDNLAQEYLQLFENIQSFKKMISSISFTSVNLEGDPSKISNNPVKYKIFYGQDDPNDYLEYYINFDLPNNLVYLMEKDPSYRKPFLKAFLK